MIESLNSAELKMVREKLKEIDEIIITGQRIRDIREQKTTADLTEIQACYKNRMCEQAHKFVYFSSETEKITELTMEHVHTPKIRAWCVWECEKKQNCKDKIIKTAYETYERAKEKWLEKIYNLTKDELKKNELF